MNKKYIKIINKKNFFNFFSPNSKAILVSLLGVLIFNSQGILGAYLSDGKVQVSSNTGLLSNKAPQIFGENGLFLGTQDNEELNAVMHHGPGNKSAPQVISSEKFLSQGAQGVPGETPENETMIPIKSRKPNEKSPGNQGRRLLNVPQAPRLGSVQTQGVSSVVGGRSLKNSPKSSSRKKSSKKRNLRSKNRKRDFPKGKAIKRKSKGKMGRK